MNFLVYICTMKKILNRKNGQLITLTDEGLDYLIKITDDFTLKFKIIENETETEKPTESSNEPTDIGPTDIGPTEPSNEPTATSKRGKKRNSL